MKPRELLLLALLGAGCAAPVENDQPLAVTYLANEGFLIESGSTKLLIDALFDDETIEYCDVPDSALRARMEAAQGLFSDVDLVLVTHAHVDHFDPRCVLAHLRSNARATLVCPSPAAAAMQAERLGDSETAQRTRAPALEPGRSVDLVENEIRLTAMRLRHGRYLVMDEETGRQYDRHEKVENLAYLVDLGRWRILHLGDAALLQNEDLLEGLKLNERSLDLAFVQCHSRDAESVRILSDLIAPTQVVWMHLPAERQRKEALGAFLAQAWPGSSVFLEPLETRTFSAPGAPLP
ncbi:MAG: MBL fold metallo-hydrolase [Planctomycetes bacterium]|nr:MBL fold metallo-hydrolase [Planctomycetota bacterium]